jgi:hypothetical protein
MYAVLAARHPHNSSLGTGQEACIAMAICLDVINYLSSSNPGSQENPTSTRADTSSARGSSHHLRSQQIVCSTNQASAFVGDSRLNAHVLVVTMAYDAPTDQRLRRQIWLWRLFLEPAIKRLGIKKPEPILDLKRVLIRLSRNVSGQATNRQRLGTLRATTSSLL